MNNDLAQIIKQFPFVEKQRPAPKAEPGQAIPVDDYTQEKQLKALMSKVPVINEFNVVQELCIGLSAT